MKLKKRTTIYLLFLVLFIFSGCGKKERYADFSKEDQMLAWSDERTRSFGDHDESEIKTEKEALDVLQKKYKVDITTYYDQTKQTLLKELSSKTVSLKQPLYAVFAQNKDLVFKTVYPFYKEKELQVFAEVIFTYNYAPDQKTAYLKSQVIQIKIAPVNGELPNKNVGVLITALGKNMYLPEEQLQSGLAGYEKQVKETKSTITSDYLPVVSTSPSLNKEKAFFKEIAVGYDSTGTLKEIYAEISDQKSK